MSNMGTVEKIVEVLNNMCHDKKAQATSRYVEHSTWLSSEFSSIRNLIQPVSSTTETTTTESAASSAIRHKRKSPETCSAGSRNSPLHKRNSGADIDVADLLAAQDLPVDLNKLKKDQLLEHIHERGGGDMTMKALKKDMVDRLQELVIDIHRRSIPVIPEELSNRDNFQGKEQAEENTVVDVADIQIKEEVEESKKEEESESSSMNITEDDKEAEVAPLNSNVSEVQKEATKTEIEQDDGKMDSSVDLPVEVIDPSTRKKSILSEYRQQLTANTTTTAASLAPRSSGIMRPPQQQAANGLVQEDQTSRVQSEFEARRLRHRMSQAGGRPSTGSGTSNDLHNNTSAPQTEEDIGMEEVSMHEESKTNDSSTSNSANDEQQEPTSTEEELPLQSLMEPSNLTVEMETDNDDEDSNWNEVPSPKRGNSVDNTTDQEAQVVSQTVVSKTEITAIKTSVSVKEEPTMSEEQKGDITATTVAPVSANSKAALSSASSSDTTTAAASAPSSTSVDATFLKKPTNVVGGNQLSFLSSSKTSASVPVAGGKTKTVVPALAMAARQKEKEEARAQMKKKELEEKKKEHLRKMQQQKTGTGSSRALGNNVKAPTTSAASGGSSKEQKGFGWTLGGKGKEQSTASGESSNSSVNSSSSSGSKENKTTASSVSKLQSASSSTAVLTEKKIIPAEYRQVTPAKTPQQQQTQAPPSANAPSPPREEYKIEYNDDDSDSDSGSGTDDDEDEDEKKKQIPDWAKGPKLREALERQYGLNGHTAVDPDQIFTDVQTCSLEEIFGKREGKCGKYSVRTSSAKWDEDEITLVEKRKYRTVMGYI